MTGKCDTSSVSAVPEQECILNTRNVFQLEIILVCQCTALCSALNRNNNVSVFSINSFFSDFVYLFSTLCCSTGNIPMVTVGRFE